MKNGKWTALYERISREENGNGESCSIVYQKEYLERYAAANGFENCRHYTDDGFSGGNFERPGWKRMLADIEADKIDTVLVKDMSRVGRNYLQTGFYTEVYFKKKAIHFISIDSHVDSSCSDNIEFVPMLNVLNEMYLRDQSRKLDKISEEQFDVLSAQYEAELDTLEKAVFAQQERLKVFRTDEENIDRFLKLVDEYQHCENYSDEMLAKMIEKVVVHERTKSESGEPIRAMEMYLSFIGRLPMQ